MASYTMELYNVMANREDIGLSDYPIFDESHREALNNKITAQYLTREIGSETVDLFVHRLRARMHLIMPYYNQLYESEKIAFDAISNVHVETENESSQSETGETDSDTRTHATNSNRSRAVNSTMPQVALSGNGSYATDMTDTNGTTIGDQDSVVATTAKTDTAGSGKSVTKGYQGSPHDLMAAHRANMLNIDALIVGQLGDLFMLVWGDPSDMLPDYFTTLPNL